MMRKIVRSMAMAALAISASYVVVALAREWTREPLSPLRSVPEPYRFEAVLPTKSSLEFEIPIENTGNQPARLLGALNHCAKVCFIAEKFPVEIPPGEVRTMHLQVTTGRPGDVSGELVVFTDRPTQPRLVLKFVGKVEGPYDEVESTTE
ncbi:MAG: hypothetical protein SFX72_11625 [Isosphaeraceae bacterium]|nr:hypothetical protein [Isosphaeraceae bacterium]